MQLYWNCNGDAIDLLYYRYHIASCFVSVSMPYFVHYVYYSFNLLPGSKWPTEIPNSFIILRAFKEIQ